mmetsp:Transcript_51681/g.157017  ORF Transcript_51681/g.157017 Transcript_51681/m.157017 type:complete len:284 (-) Transcript_51681:1257-2108(-)
MDRRQWRPGGVHLRQGGHEIWPDQHDKHVRDAARRVRGLASVEGGGREVRGAGSVRRPNAFRGVQGGRLYRPRRLAHRHLPRLVARFAEGGPPPARGQGGPGRRPRGRGAHAARAPQPPLRQPPAVRRRGSGLQRGACQGGPVLQLLARPDPFRVQGQGHALGPRDRRCGRPAVDRDRDVMLRRAGHARRPEIAPDDYPRTNFLHDPRDRHRGVPEGVQDIPCRGGALRGVRRGGARARGRRGWRPLAFLGTENAFAHGLHGRLARHQDRSALRRRHVAGQAR